MNKKYRVVFMGLLRSEEDFKQKMSGLGVSLETAELIIRKAPVVLKENMTLGHARQYAEAIQDAGGKVKLQEHGFFEEPERKDRPFFIKPFEHFIVCSQCGYKQLKVDTCVKCGFVLEQGKNGKAFKDA